MKQFLVELDDETAAKLESVAPSRSRRRSEFVRRALRQALWDIEERATAEAYTRQPDAAAAYLSADVWEPHPGARPTRTRRPTRGHS